ncbi:MAG: rhodanese-like domain-containing protein [Saprospiraceae bacterium]|nr:rhodanese-like domain-containing protein [Saprospiraceae bacterium]
MKFVMSLILFVSVTILAGAQSKIDATKLQLLKSENKKIQLVDLRTPGEINKTGKIDGALSINYSAPDFESQVASLDKEKPVILYCAAGGRSAKAAGVLSKKGFKTVYDYTGGMSDWVSKGLKTVK